MSQKSQLRPLGDEKDEPSSSLLPVESNHKVDIDIRPF